MSSTSRQFPLNQPPSHNPPPRLRLQFPDDTQRVFTAYIGAQVHSRDAEDAQQNLALLNEPRTQIQHWLADPINAPVSTEQFLVVDDSPNHTSSAQSRPSPTSNSVLNSTPNSPSIVWVCYWTNETKYHTSISNLALREIHASLNPASRPYIGLWAEYFPSDVQRLETVYSATDYLPGLARLPGTSTAQHVHTGYWGAARDRIPASADDLFEENVRHPPLDQPVTELLGSYVVGTSPHNMIHIRSGQLWTNCDEEERDDYLNSLEPKLRGGLDYLWRSPGESGSSAVRYLVNISLDETNLPSESRVDIPFQKKDEACVTAFFRSFAHLEHWSARHRSHLVIHAGAVKHGKKYGDGRKFRTWHEVSVLKDGEGRFEYVNCLPGTGAMRDTVVVEKQDLNTNS